MEAGPRPRAAASVRFPPGDKPAAVRGRRKAAAGKKVIEDGDEKDRAGQDAAVLRRRDVSQGHARRGDREGRHRGGPRDQGRQDRLPQHRAGDGPGPVRSRGQDGRLRRERREVLRRRDAEHPAGPPRDEVPLLPMRDRLARARPRPRVCVSEAQLRGVHLLAGPHGSGDAPLHLRAEMPRSLRGIPPLGAILGRAERRIVGGRGQTGPAPAANTCIRGSSTSRRHPLSWR